MATNFIDQMDEDMTNTFLNTDEFAAQVTVTDLSGGTTTPKAVFVFQAGAVDEKERAVFYLADSVTIARGYYITLNAERWIVVDVRPDDRGMNEVRCDRPEVTS